MQPVDHIEELIRIAIRLKNLWKKSFFMKSVILTSDRLEPFLLNTDY